MEQELNLGTILSNAVEQSTINEPKIEHILSNISPLEVLSLSDEDNTLKILTSQNDIFNLENSNWKQMSSNDGEGFSTYISLGDESVKLLVDETRVEFI